MNKLKILKSNEHAKFFMNKIKTFYTPGVAQYVTDKSSIFKNKKVLIVSNGTATLGLGDQGSGVIPVLEAKGMFYESDGFISYPLYLNSKSVDEMVKLISQIHQNFDLIHIEDIKSPECFQLETELLKRVDTPLFHDDQWATAIAISKKLLKQDRSKTIHVYGIGAAGLATIMTLKKLSFTNIFAFGRHGLIEEHSTKTEGKLRIPSPDILITLTAPGALDNTDLNLEKVSIFMCLSNPSPDINIDKLREIKSKNVKVYTGFPNSEFDHINNSEVFVSFGRFLINNGNIKDLASSSKEFLIKTQK